MENNKPINREIFGYEFKKFNEYNFNEIEYYESLYEKYKDKEDITEDEEKELYFASIAASDIVSDYYNTVYELARYCIIFANTKNNEEMYLCLNDIIKCLDYLNLNENCNSSPMRIRLVNTITEDEVNKMIHDMLEDLSYISSDINTYFIESLFKDLSILNKSLFYSRLYDFAKYKKDYQESIRRLRFLMED